MQCIACGHLNTHVVDSRMVEGGTSIRRRRECLACKQRFTTYETADIRLPRIVKSNGARQTFNEEKLRSGMMRALEKRPVATSRIDDEIDQIKKTLQATGAKEVTARKIGDLVMQALRRLDQVAYIRFASVYLSFDNVEAFRAAIEGLNQDSLGQESLSTKSEKNE
ncbi:MAG: transcriptional regulator NrdR [Halothiobacillus sp. 14-56-357]|uniref:transcriptional regulator NrdR n=1 Tax=Halothiobacillus sp. 15-55-196 TaxID=1970382 RepID=UPI000BDB60ED|nr:transcriptional regulator NrdR [Halothiobacillus sp. 15-55-196]OZB36505.1 MAG: transcriptional regulator NrdR [Halothiobacillus sp. 15-55-196]OZB56900.1 MAG: transcriptional regulator NrdR [Halothiobacillus sp. 14-56-357]OZB78119.1 MAG: transcriptional regulator NrdR [Halothiobacillus sp. 13-55-115]